MEFVVLMPFSRLIMEHFATNTYLPFSYGTLPYHLATVIFPRPKTEIRKLKT